MSQPRIDADRLEAFGRAVIAAEGASDTVAADVAGVLVRANLRGHDSHGIARLTLYDQMIADGTITPAAAPELVAETPTTATVDGNGLFGQAVGGDLMELALDKAETHGLSLVGARNATHLGRIGEWAERATADGYGFVGMVNTQGGGLSVAPPGSTDRRLSTNPLTLGIPTFDALPFDLIYDAATSQVANGKIYEKRAADEPIPKGWTVAADGSHLRDPEAYVEADAGAMLPLGGQTAGYKGFGIATMIEVFAGITGDGPIAGEHDPPWFNNSAWFLVFDPLVFTDRSRLTARIEALAAHLRSATPADSPGPGARGTTAKLPGEPEHETTADRVEHGVPVPAAAVDALNELASELGVDERLT